MPSINSQVQGVLAWGLEFESVDIQYHVGTEGFAFVPELDRDVSVHARHDWFSVRIDKRDAHAMISLFDLVETHPQRDRALRMSCRELPCAYPVEDPEDIESPALLGRCITDSEHLDFHFVPSFLSCPERPA